MKKQYCSGECDFQHYYCDQGGNGLEYYTGFPHQRGYGFWGKAFSRFGIPILKYLGKQAFETGRNVALDVVDKKDSFKGALKQRLKESGKQAGLDAINKGLPKIVEEVQRKLAQAGTGKKRKAPCKRNPKKIKGTKKSKKRKLDIFD
jgi:hypothetical protein